MVLRSRRVSRRVDGKVVNRVKVPHHCINTESTLIIDNLDFTLHSKPFTSSSTIELRAEDCHINTGYVPLRVVSLSGTAR